MYKSRAQQDLADALSSFLNPQHNTPNQPRTAMACCSKSSLPITDAPCGYSTPSPRNSFLRVFGEPYVSVVLVVVMELLTVAWYIVVPFIVDKAAMHSKYTFEPRPVTAYTGWGTAMLVIMPMVAPWVGYSLGAEKARAARWMLYLGCSVCVVMLIVGNIFGAIETNKREAFELGFAVKFNDFYCDTRTLRVCLEGSRDSLLVLTRSNATTTVVNATSQSSIDDAALSVWSRCQEVLLESMALEAKRDKAEGDTEEGEKEIEAQPLYRFLDDCTSSHEVDMWCGNSLHRTSPMTDEEQLAYPAPYAANPDMFAKYTREWSRRMLFSNVLLGSAAGCLLLAALLIKIAERMMK